MGTACANGQQLAGVYAACTTIERREAAVRLLDRLGVDTGPAFIASMGWGESPTD